MGLLSNTVYVRVRRNEFRVKNAESGAADVVQQEADRQRPDRAGHEHADEEERSLFPQLRQDILEFEDYRRSRKRRT